MALFPILAGLGALAGCMSNPRRKRRSKARRCNPSGRKIDLFVDGVYVASTTQSTTLKEAIRKFKASGTYQGYVPGKGFGSIKAPSGRVTAAYANPRRKRRNPNGSEITAHELVLFIVNDGDLYRQQTQPILKNLAKKIKKGTYDHAKAVKLWGYLADNGAQRYTKESGSGGSTSYGIFSKPIRMIAAKELQDYYQEDLDDTVKSNPRRRRSKRSRR